MQKILDVDCGPGGSYPVLFGHDAPRSLAGLWKADWKQAVIIGDSTTLRLFEASIREVLQELTFQVVALSFPAGERSKTRRTKERIEQSMLDAGIGRSACIVAVGGGVVLDLAGFVASTYMRGIAHINIPTTLLAQVDASIGGKTGVNTSSGKNLIGAFHQPRAVLIDPGTLLSLPARELRSGLAEVIKHAVVSSAALFSQLETWLSSSAGLILPDDLLRESVAIKARVVQEDVRDEGKRQILNFGHTVGHAIENATSHRVRHGHAVAAGMLVEASVAREMTGFPQQDFERLRALVRSAGLPLVPQCAFDEAIAPLLLDKKGSRDSIRCALPERIGVMASVGGHWVIPVPEETLRRAWVEVRP
ncbi:MAG: 3-dehydroquinate synthase [Acidobacteriota bacterium]